MAHVIIIRHGQTTDNADKIFSGKRDVDLTESGIEEAEKIAEKLKNENISKAYHSGQLRSIHTLDIVLKGHSNVQIFEDERIRERDYGDLTGENKIEWEKKDPQNYALWHRSYDVPPPGGESIKDVEKRVSSFLQEEMPKWNEKDIVLISAHGNSIRPMRKYFENLTNNEMCSYEYTPGHIFSYEI